jgi:hypothetical protein
MLIHGTKIPWSSGPEDVHDKFCIQTRNHPRTTSPKVTDNPLHSVPHAYITTYTKDKLDRQMDWA